MSAIIYEVLDMGTGDHRRRRAARLERRGHPGFVGVLDKAVRRILELNPRRARSARATSSPPTTRTTAASRTSTTSCSRCRCSPTASSSRGRRTSRTGTTSAGWCPARSPPTRREIYQEGLRLPAVKLIDAGAPNELGAARSWRRTARLPDFLQRRHVGGHRGGPDRRAAARRSSSRSTGSDTFVAALAHFMDYGEQVARRGARASCRRARFALEEEQDSGAVYRVTVEITDDEFIVDLRDNPDQDAGPEQLRPRRRDGRRADGVQGAHRRPTAPRTAAASGRSTRADAARARCSTRSRAGRVRASTTRSRSGSTT